MLLRTTAEIAPGALIEAQTDDRVILGEVAHTRVLDDGVELSVEAHHTFSRSWQPYPSWQGAAEPESVLDSLLALNRQLEDLARLQPGSAPSPRAEAHPSPTPRARR